MKAGDLLVLRRSNIMLPTMPLRSLALVIHVHVGNAALTSMRPALFGVSVLFEGDEKCVQILACEDEVVS